MALDTVRVNGDKYSWKSVIAKIDNESLSNRMTACDYASKRDRKYVYGNDRSGGPVGMTGGKVDPGTSSLSVLREMAFNIMAYLAKKGGGASYGNVEFTFQLQLVEKNNDVITVTWHKCHITEAKHSHKEGNDELATDFSIMHERIVETVNGVDLTIADDEEADV